MAKLAVGTASAAQETRAQGVINMTQLPSGLPLDIAVIVLNGAEDRPCLWVDAVIHGDEPEGTLCCHMLNELDKRVHPIVGFPTCNVGVIQGGSTANAVPDSCIVKIDRRMIPGEHPEVVKSELRAVVEFVDVSPAEVSLDDFIFSRWFDSSLDTDSAQTFLSCVKDKLNDDPGPIGYLPGSDAKHLMELEKGDMIIFGPGSYEVAHAFDEHVQLDDYQTTTDILLNFVQQTIYDQS